MITINHDEPTFSSRKLLVTLPHSKNSDVGVEAGLTKAIVAFDCFRGFSVMALRGGGRARQQRSSRHLVNARWCWYNVENSGTDVNIALELFCHVSCTVLHGIHFSCGNICYLKKKNSLKQQGGRSTRQSFMNLDLDHC